MADKKDPLFKRILLGSKKVEKEKSSKNPLVKGEPNVDPKYGDKRLLLILEGIQEGVERYYYWCLRFTQAKGQFGLGFDEIHKVKDVYKAGEASAFFGATERRKMDFQDKISQYLRGISEMIKGLFPIIRELRIMDERKGYYQDSKAGGDKAQSAEIALKSIWVDMVEGGAENAGSVYGLARKVGFVTLPDFFYQINPKKGKDGVEAAVNALEVNNKVKEVLMRKLYQYYNWKEQTEKEIEQRRGFLLKYLRQHYNTIKLYITWIKPYLETVNRMQQSGSSAVTDADIAAAFDTSKVELEYIASSSGYKKYKPVLKVKFKFVAIPQMSYHNEYQRGAVHMGRTEIEIEPYLVTDEQLKEYVEKKDTEDLELLKSLYDSLDAVGDDLKKYLKEAKENIPEEEKKEEEEEKGMLEPFIALKDGFKDLFGLEMPKKKDTGSLDEKKKAKSEAAVRAWVLYDVFKKGHKMITP